MAYNFKSIADVEVVAEPAESANVLIEENGVIKKAPKTAVGGAGETLAIFYDFSQGYEPISAPDNLYEILNEEYKNMTHTNIVACNLGRFYDGYIYYEYPDYMWKNEESIEITFGNSVVMWCYPDGRIGLSIVD